MSSPYKTFTCLTFGCKVNFADTASISKQLIDLGCTQSYSTYAADIFIINTCSVTEMADKKVQTAKKFTVALTRKNKDKVYSINPDVRIPITINL